MDGGVVLATALTLMMVGLSMWYFVQLQQRLPRSLYKTLLLTACGSLAAVAILSYVTVNVAGGDNSDSGGSGWQRVSKTLLLVTFTSHCVAIVLAELQFLLVLAPFVAFLSPAVVGGARVAVVCVGVVLVVFAAVEPTALGINWHDWFGIAAQIYETWQQCFMLGFVLRRLELGNGTSTGAYDQRRFRFVFSLLVAFSVLLLIPGFYFKQLDALLPPSMANTFATLSLSFEFCAFQAIILIQSMLISNRRRSRHPLITSDDQTSIADSADSTGRVSSTRCSNEASSPVNAADTTFATTGIEITTDDHLETAVNRAPRYAASSRPDERSALLAYPAHTALQTQASNSTSIASMASVTSIASTTIAIDNADTV